MTETLQCNTLKVLVNIFEKVKISKISWSNNTSKQNKSRGQIWIINDRQEFMLLSVSI